MSAGALTIEHMLTPLDDITIVKCLGDTECPFHFDERVQLTRMGRRLRALRSFEVDFVGDLLLSQKEALEQLFKRWQVTGRELKVLLASSLQAHGCVLDQPIGRDLAEAFFDQRLTYPLPLRLQRRGKLQIRIRCPVCRTWQLADFTSFVRDANNNRMPSHCTCDSSTASSSVTLSTDSMHLKRTVDRRW